MRISRGPRGRTFTAAAVGVAAAVTVAASGCSLLGGSGGGDLCAIMPDAIGLYPGNDVTQMGVRIGRVTSVAPRGDSVKVSFSVSDRRLPASVKAVTRSTSILADRALELVGNYTSGPTLNPGTCIARADTATPRSITQTTEAATKLVDSLTRGGASGDIAQLTRILDAQTTPAVSTHANSALTDTSTLLSDPAGFVGDVSSILADLRPLLGSTAAQWGQLLTSLDHGPAVLQAYGQTVFPAVTAIYTGLPGAINMSADMVLRYGDILSPTLDTAAAAIHLAATSVHSIDGLVKMLPVFGDSLAALAGRGGAAGGYQITMPQVQVPVADPQALCGRLNGRRPGSCTVAGAGAQLATIDLLQSVYQGAQR
ncbi:MlaD family protein [Tsukamurella soli]|uniref:Mce/MlaD domain-containing protein n=1 Tax=Tsukamurella soli TaxID=644556 RepID=A0ABP8JHX2_9ACTN